MNIPLSYRFTPATVLLAALCSPSHAQLGNSLNDIKAKEASLCQANEQVIFVCKIKSKTLSMCLTDGSKAKLTYRFGAKGKLPEKEVSASRFPASGRENYQLDLLSPGGVRVRFEANETDYVVYENTHKLALPVQSAGVVVFEKGTQQKVLSCTSQAYVADGLYNRDSWIQLLRPIDEDSSQKEIWVDLPEMSYTPCGELSPRDASQYCAQ